MVVKMQPQKVLYCEVCSLPPEYCEFGPDFASCVPWLLENAPEQYPHLQAEAADRAADKMEGLGVSAALSEEPGKAAASGSGEEKKEEVKKLPGGKVKKKEAREILVEKVTRNKRKAITIIRGLELFGIKLSDASKKFGKKFASGASVVKGPTEKEQIDVQGDIMYDVVEFVTDTWPEVPESSIFFIEDGKKVPALE